MNRKQTERIARILSRKVERVYLTPNAVSDLLLHYVTSKTIGRYNEITHRGRFDNPFTETMKEISRARARLRGKNVKLRFEERLYGAAIQELEAIPTTITRRSRYRHWQTLTGRDVISAGIYLSSLGESAFARVLDEHECIGKNATSINTIVMRRQKLHFSLPYGSHSFPYLFPVPLTFGLRKYSARWQSPFMALPVTATPHLMLGDVTLYRITGYARVRDNGALATTWRGSFRSPIYTEWWGAEATNTSDRIYAVRQTQKEAIHACRKSVIEFVSKRI
jgi:hypothetical protein